MKVGIDRLNFYVPGFYLDLSELAKAQNKPEDTYITATGQYRMAVPAPNEDIVTMAANAAERVLESEDRHQIAWLLFATETGIDQSKAAGMYLHHLLGLSPHCRVVELKQACYGATAGLQLAMGFLRTQPSGKKVLLVASDIARYEMNTPAESSQGAGSVAMLLAQNPRILAIEPYAGYYALDAMDFWRPNYRREAFVDGKLSCDLYLRCLKETWLHYQEHSNLTFNDHAGFCYHVPVPRLAEKAYQRQAKLAGLRFSNEEAFERLLPALRYAKEVGNCYTASLYMSLISWLNHAMENSAHQRVGLYSYGSGCTAEYFSGIVQPDYRHYLDAADCDNRLMQRKALSVEDYRSFCAFNYPVDGSRVECPQFSSGHFTLEAIDQHQRIYRRC